MEKFSQWRDKGTGVAPFLPHPSSTLGGAGVAGAASALAAALAVLAKAPLLALAGLVAAVAAGLGLPALAASAVLYAAGFWFWDVQVDGVRRGKKTLAANRDRAPAAGDVVVTNYLSPLDAAVYAALFPCVFAIPGERGGVGRYSAAGVWAHALRFAATAEPHTLADIAADARRAGRAVVLFVEGTPSNGRALVHPLWAALDTLADGRVLPCALKYAPMDVSTPIPPRSAVHYALRVLARWRGWSVRVRLGAPVPAASLPGLPLRGEKAVCDELCRLGRMLRTGPELDMASKRDFVRAWSRGR
ncbi:uncharacterized protein V1510DRAFT_411270 [Dipodascopsis tothii]|uniref:uncharacterized protein n=1 Tax=Dipodascopsis tothii TaxID=44089 RepID=UPI0034CD208D